MNIDCARLVVKVINFQCPIQLYKQLWKGHNFSLKFPFYISRLILSELIILIQNTKIEKLWYPPQKNRNKSQMCTVCSMFTIMLWQLTMLSFFFLFSKLHMKTSWNNPSSWPRVYSIYSIIIRCVTWLAPFCHLSPTHNLCAWNLRWAILWDFVEALLTPQPLLPLVLVSPNQFSHSRRQEGPISRIRGFGCWRISGRRCRRG